ncbi:MAG: hypothetical protein JNM53_12025 [Gemmatimonadetes bacterium]|nr:hypothetical protein [Gemmatimonadota bacterium]
MTMRNSCLLPALLLVGACSGERITSSSPPGTGAGDSAIGNAAPNPHEPAGYTRLWQNDFTSSLTKLKYVTAAQAGCWFTNGGKGVIANGKWNVTYPVGWIDGTTPATMHGRVNCPPAKPPSYNSTYIHLTGYNPGDGTPFWQNGNGYKVLFIKVGGGSLILKCDNAGGGAGLRTSCLFRANWEGGGVANYQLQSNTQLLVGRPDDIECLLTVNTPGLKDGTLSCWVNGKQVTWSRLAQGSGSLTCCSIMMRTTATPTAAYETWADWTYGGGGGMVPVGQRTVISFDGIYVSGR